MNDLQTEFFGEIWVKLSSVTTNNLFYFLKYVLQKKLTFPG